MPKRFTDTEKWKKPFVRSLPAAYKLLWFYILDDCNHAGIWEVDMEVANIKIGEDITEEMALGYFGDRVQRISSGKWFIPDFISFQYGELNEKNRLHFSVIAILRKYDLFPIKVPISPLEGAKYKDKDKEQYKDKEIGGLGENFDSLVSDMKMLFKKENPKYPFDDADPPALREIAEKIKLREGWSGWISEHREGLKTRWGEILTHIKSDRHYSGYSIPRINNHFQSITLSFDNRNGTNQRTSGKIKSGKDAGAIELLNEFREEVGGNFATGTTDH